MSWSFLKAREPLPCSLPAVSVDMQACTKMTDLGSRPWWISPIPHLPPSHNGPAAWERNNLWSATEMRACYCSRVWLILTDTAPQDRYLVLWKCMIRKWAGWRRLGECLWSCDNWSRDLRNIGRGPEGRAQDFRLWGGYVDGKHWTD